MQGEAKNGMWPNGNMHGSCWVQCMVLLANGQNAPSSPFQKKKKSISKSNVEVHDGLVWFGWLVGRYERVSVFFLFLIPPTIERL